MNITDIEHGDVVSSEWIGSEPDSDEAAATANKPSGSTSETAVVLATVRDSNEPTASVSLRRADTGAILTDVAIEALQPSSAATGEEHTPSGGTSVKLDE